MYSDNLSPKDQIDAEEWIASLIFDNPDVETDEHTAGELGRRILAEMLTRFCPELAAELFDLEDDTEGY